MMPHIVVRRRTALLQVLKSKMFLYNTCETYGTSGNIYSVNCLIPAVVFPAVFGPSEVKMRD